MCQLYGASSIIHSEGVKEKIDEIKKEDDKIKKEINKEEKVIESKNIENHIDNIQKNCKTENSAPFVFDIKSVVNNNRCFNLSQIRTETKLLNHGFVILLFDGVNDSF